MNRKVISISNLPTKLTFCIRDLILCFLAFERFNVPEWLQGIIYAFLALKLIASWWAFFAQTEIDIFDIKQKGN